MPDALIHLRVSAATKAAWVRESRAAGMRLGDWIIERVEAVLAGQQVTHSAQGVAAPAPAKNIRKKCEGP